MRRRSVLRGTALALGAGVTGCIGGDENGGATTESSGDSSGGGGDQSGEATVTVRLDASGAVQQFERLELGIGKVSLTPRDGEAPSFTVLDTFDVAGGPVTLVDSEPAPAGIYTELSMTATVDRRELASGESPPTDLDDPQAALGPLELAGGESVELTMTLAVSKAEDVYPIEAAGVSTSRG